MAEVIGVRFKETGKVYYFDPAGEKFRRGEFAVVETARGVECGEVALENRDVPDSTIVKPLRRLVRRATDEDVKRAQENRAREREAFRICEEKILAHKLDMKLVDVEYPFDNSKLLFYFTADGRVDFRNLVKDLASVFRTRIELRQIGVRDEAKMLGGLGICGQPFCCSRFLGDFQPVSIKMAKEQGLSLNPVKISGTCGRLMCCLNYEQNVYENLIKLTPRVGAQVTTPQGRGVVTSVSLLAGTVKVRLENAEAPVTFTREELEPEARPHAPKPEPDGEEAESKPRPQKEGRPRRRRGPRPEKPRRSDAADSNRPRNAENEGESAK